MIDRVDVSPFREYATVPCVVLDEWARLPSDEQIAQVPDLFDRYRIQARRAQIHLEMRMEMLKEEEDAQAKR